uniref:Retrovirus-related Pol polyprotein from transposon TNT 1-94-like beta-barrel domain-containing protein n=1 Tax=Cannabis sativa TaxID=3483 RepID=A0A803Q570_CANSA
MDETSSSSVQLDPENSTALATTALAMAQPPDVPPPQILVTSEPNPQYQKRKCQDQLILSWLWSSMYEGVLGSVANFTILLSLESLGTTFFEPILSTSSSTQRLFSLGSSYFGDDSGWFAEAGAINHVTNSVDNLDSDMIYTGTETLSIGDGKKLLISHVGSACLPSSSSAPLNLHYVLEVPYINKNLVSVSKVTEDNDVFLEFHKHCCLVKDKDFKQVLLKGTVKNGLNLL